MKSFSARNLKRSAHRLICHAEAGRLSVVTKDGAPIFVAVPFDRGLMTDDAMSALAMHLFDQECISLGRAARMAGLSIVEMTDLLGGHGIAVLRTHADELQRSLLEFGESRRA